MMTAQSVLQLVDQMLWIDYSIAAWVAGAGLLGLLRGLGRELRSLFNWVAAAIIAWFFASDFTRLIASKIHDPNAKTAAAFAIMALITLGLGSALILLSIDSRKKIYVSVFSRILGLMAGLARGIVLIQIAVIMAGLSPLPKQSWWPKSQLIPYFQRGATWLKRHVPTGFAGHIHYR